jgi:uncharacterized protein YydD (DUF2326 family)
LLKKLASNREEFVPIDFKPGFNVVLAEKHKDATDKDSRNARGKSTLIAILKFMFGSDLHSDLKPLVHEGWTFTLTLTVQGHDLTVSRSLDAPTNLSVSFPPHMAPIFEGRTKEGRIAAQDWTAVLGLLYFRLEPESPDSDKLSVRTLFSYAIRTRAVDDPLKTMTQQAAISSRTHMAFIFGMPWMNQARLNEVNQAYELVGAVSKVSNTNTLETLRSQEALQLERAEALNALEKAVNAYDSLDSLGDSAEAVRIASSRSVEANALRNDLFVAERQLEQISQPAGADNSKLRADEAAEASEIFEASSVLLTPIAQRRLQDVIDFHLALSENRAELIANEAARLLAEIEALTSRLTELDAERDETFAALRTNGVLDEITTAQSSVRDLELKVAQLNASIAQAEEVETKRAQLKAERATLRKEIQEELPDNASTFSQISDDFRTKMRQLYDATATLTVTVDNDGYKYAAKVSGGSSSGVSRMKQLSFDLALLQFGGGTGHYPNFLVHDSVIFDGVDPRQRGRALRFAAEVSSSAGAQYICALNSNDVPEDVREESWFKAGLARIVYDTEEGGILGIKF